MLYALIVDLAWGAAAGWFRAPPWMMIIGALGAAAFGFWLERTVLLRSAPEDRLRRNLLLIAAYGFVALVASGLSGVAYGLAAWLHR